MPDPATGSWLAFNGEIYNYADLRRELEALGHRFRSTGDTEVLLKSLIEWGPEAMKRLRGMYAFAFWDGRGRRLVLGRDPQGIKPLLLMRSGDSILFASELRALSASGLAELTLSRMGVRSYLTFGTVIEPASIVEEVVALPPGHAVIADAQGHLAPPRRILGLEDLLPRSLRRERVSYRHAIASIEGALERSVREQLASDVPVGVFLSGGIDSSILATLADRAASGREVNFLTVCFSEVEFSELGYASQVARGLGGRHRVIPLDVGQMRDLLPKALSAVDRPTVDGINTFVISHVAAGQGLKVLLSGLGGDEVFGGYTTFWKAPVLWRHRALLSRLASVLPTRVFGSESERQKVVLSAQGFDLRDAYVLQRAIRWSPESSRIAMLGTLPDNAMIPPETWELMTTNHRHDDYHRISYLESVFYMRNQLLRDADIFSSANAVELRGPFLDLDLIGKAWSFPGSHHRSMTGGGKRILKDILARMHPGLPLRRRKMGFVFPWQHWLRDPKIHEMLADTMHSPDAYAGLGVEPAEGREILRSFMACDSLTSWSQVWSLFVLLHWNGRFRAGFRA
jgi:asparagine synthase (glutamine-hydrolysing)